MYFTKQERINMDKAYKDLKKSGRIKVPKFSDSIIKEREDAQRKKCVHSWGRSKSKGL
jgi:ethanolamine utilization protein EutQ (cupin superfamily)